MSVPADQSKRSALRGVRSRPVYTLVCGIATLLFTGLIAGASSRDEATPVVDAGAATNDPMAEYRRPAAIPYPTDNEHTAPRELLGRTLFFDPRLSGSGWISCATCHNPGLAWGDGLALATGHGMGQLGRRTPTILNLAWAPALFWDGRAGSLEEQALGPIESAGEMNLKLDVLLERLNGIEGYRTLFARAYPNEPISGKTVAKAIATFERGVVSGTAPFDRWIAGDTQAMSPAAQRGFGLFNNKARCSTCHTGWRFSDDGFYDIGVATDDPGRGKLLPDIAIARFAFKTPTLRNVELRAPFMHNGTIATLAGVIDLYDRGGIVRRPSLSPDVVPLGLTATEKQDLVHFLRALTSPDSEARIPALPR
jgi:cytochrome c peroxidase